MIEAYTIGIRLALDDGVSSHIRAIREDLAAIDRAVDISGTRIRDLARLGRGLVEPEQWMRIDTHRENVAPVPEERTTAKPQGQAAELSSDSDEIDGGGRASARTQPVSPDASGPGRAFVTQPSNQSAISVAPIETSTPAQPVVRADPANRLPEMSASAVPDRQSTNLAELGRAISPVSTSLLSPSINPPMAEVPQDLRGEQRATTQPMPATNQVHYVPVPMSVGRSVTPSVPSPSVVAPPLPPQALGPIVIALPPPMQNAPISTSEPAWHVETIAPVPTTAFAPGPANSARVVPGHATERSGGEPSTQQEPAHGELMIDGLAIGRWISDHLADRVVRPHSGFSGMDPRLSPAWPGVVSSG